MTGAIEFLQHAKACCKTNAVDYETCTKCPININDRCHLFIIDELTDEELVELVRRVEKWWRENE